MCLLHSQDGRMIVSNILEGLDQRLKNAFSKHFSKGVITRFARRNVESASKTHSESLVGPSEIFVREHKDRRCAILFCNKLTLPQKTI